ncbi:MAG TPA: hypothetical protein RMI62_07300, partial [Polyangiaceae bacterium LLY-WYZ-15_(1-7)]|nr:hypothetical protein [Polyangiaceae bacterium LLY-WYZ-15_(1-7)]
PALDEPLALGETVQLVDEVAPFAEVRAARVISAGGYADATLSPDGTRLALSHDTFAGVSVQPADGSALPQVLREGRALGIAPVWRPDGRALGLRAPGQTETAVPLLNVDLGGRDIAPEPSDALRARVDDAGHVLVGVGARTERLGPPGDRYFAPRVGPEERFVAFQGLSSGLYLHDLDRGVTYHLAQGGGHARFDPAGRWLVFERLEDDGHVFTAGDVMIVDLQPEVPAMAPLVATDALERAPDLAGGRLSYLRGNEGVEVVVAELAFTR